MSRGLSTANSNQVASASVQVVLLAKLEFDTTVYVHTGIGTITYDGNDYLGVGDFGGISEARESELLGPDPLTLSLSGLDSTMVDEALNSAAYGDVVTIYEGYRVDDGTLDGDPWVVWKGWVEYAQVQRGGENTVSLICQHDLAVLNEKEGSRFTDEDQQAEYSGDLGFEFVADMVDKKLYWGGGPTVTGRRYPYGHQPGPRGRPRVLN